MGALYTVLVADFVSSPKKLEHTAKNWDLSVFPKLEVPGKGHQIPPYITFTIIVHLDSVPLSPWATTDLHGPSVHLFCVAKLSDESIKILKTGKLSPALKLWD